MIKKIIMLYIFGISLLSTVNSFASTVDATIQFKNEDKIPIVSTMKPYLDNFSWADLTLGYKAVWNFPKGPQSFKEVEKLTLASQESISAKLSYD